MEFYQILLFFFLILTVKIFNLKKILLLLLTIEYLNLFLFLYLYMYMNMSVSFYIVVLVFILLCVSEGVLGLCLYIKMIRTVDMNMSRSIRKK